MSNQGDMKSEDIEDFLNETFMVLDEIEEFRDAEADVTKNGNAGSSSGCKNSNRKSSSRSRSNSSNKVKTEDRSEQKELIVVIKQEDKEKCDESSTVEKDDEESEQNNCETENSEHVEEEEHEDEEGEQKGSDGEEDDEVQSVKVEDQKQEVDEDKSLEDIDDGEPEIDSHPYLYLIENFQFTKEQQSVIEMSVPKSVHDTHLHVIYSKSDMFNLLQSLKGVKEIAVDIEVDAKKFKTEVCLLMISTKEKDYIIDTMKLKNEILLLTEIFINPKIVKVLFKYQYVLQFLQLAFHLFMVNIFDVEKAAIAVLKKNELRLHRLIQTEIPDVPRLQYKLSDCTARPLTDNTKIVSRYGAHYLLYLYHKYKNHLLENDKSQYTKILNDCRNYCKVLFPRDEKTHLHQLTEELKVRQNCQLDVLHKLYKWRQNLGKRKNKNPKELMSNPSLLYISSALPGNSSLLLTCSTTPTVKDNVEKLLDIISDSKVKFGIHDFRHLKKKAAAEKSGKAKEADKPKTFKRKSLAEIKQENSLQKQRRLEIKYNKIKSEASCKSIAKQEAEKLKRKPVLGREPTKLNKKPLLGREPTKLNKKPLLQPQFFKRPNPPAQPQSNFTPSIFIPPTPNPVQRNETNTGFTQFVPPQFQNQNQFNQNTSLHFEPAPPRVRKSRFEPIGNQPINTFTPPKQEFGIANQIMMGAMRPNVQGDQMMMANSMPSNVQGNQMMMGTSMQSNVHFQATTPPAATRLNFTPPVNIVYGSAKKNEGARNTFGGVQRDVEHRTSRFDVMVPLPKKQFQKRNVPNVKTSELFNRPQETNRFNSFDNTLTDIDKKIDTLEKTVSKFQSPEEKDPYRRRY